MRPPRTPDSVFTLPFKSGKSGGLSLACFRFRFRLPHDTAPVTMPLPTWQLPSSLSPETVGGHVAVLTAAACVLLAACACRPTNPTARRPPTPPMARDRRLDATLQRVAPSQNGFLPARVPCFEFGGEMGRVVEVRRGASKGDTPNCKSPERRRALFSGRRHPGRPETPHTSPSPFCIPARCFCFLVARSPQQPRADAHAPHPLPPPTAHSHPSSHRSLTPPRPTTPAPTRPPSGPGSPRPRPPSTPTRSWPSSPPSPTAPPPAAPWSRSSTSPTPSGGAPPARRSG